jgi:hypothetical protein
MESSSDHTTTVDEKKAPPTCHLCMMQTNCAKKLFTKFPSEGLLTVVANPWCRWRLGKPGDVDPASVEYTARGQPVSRHISPVRNVYRPTSSSSRPFTVHCEATRARRMSSAEHRRHGLLTCRRNFWWSCCDLSASAEAGWAAAVRQHQEPAR